MKHISITLLPSNGLEFESEGENVLKGGGNFSVVVVVNFQRFVSSNVCRNLI